MYIKKTNIRDIENVVDIRWLCSDIDREIAEWIQSNNRSHLSRPICNVRFIWIYFYDLDAFLMDFVWFSVCTRIFPSSSTRRRRHCDAATRILFIDFVRSCVRDFALWQAQFPIELEFCATHRLVEFRGRSHGNVLSNSNVHN